MNFQAVLDKWQITTPLEDIMKMWNDPSRLYHGKSHLDDLIQQIQNYQQISSKEREMLFLIALFHDIIYDPQRTDNEERSADFFLNSVKNQTNDIREISKCILDTRNHNSSSLISKIFCEMDMDIVKRPLQDLLKWEEGISFEYSFLSTNEYIIRRTAFLEKIIQQYPENLEALCQLIAFVKNRKA